MKKILHITNTNVVVDNRILKEIGALSSLEDVKIFAVGVLDEACGGANVGGCAQYVGLQLLTRRFRFLPRSIRYVFEMVEFTCKAVREGLRIKSAVIHCHDTFALPAGYVLKLLSASHLVYDAHELESNKSGQSRVLRLVTYIIERVSWSKIDYFVTVSGSIAEWYVAQFGGKRSVVILNSPLCKDDVSGTGLALTRSGGCLRDLYRIPPADFIFVYIGALESGRGINFYLELFSSADERAHVVFIGGGTLESEVKLYAARHSNIHFHRQVEHDKIVPLVSDADYGLCLIEKVSLSDYYALPNKFFEYIFAGLPVIASDFPEIKALVRRYDLGICCGPAAADLKFATTLAKKSRRTISRMAIADLSWDVQAGRLVWMYRELLGKK
jgi:glycosyltransferase involved in cell wall biosynthesis